METNFNVRISTCVKISIHIGVPVAHWPLQVVIIAIRCTFPSAAPQNLFPQQNMYFPLQNGHFPVGITYNLQNAIFTYRRGFPLRLAALLPDFDRKCNTAS